MSVRINFLLTLLVWPSLAASSALNVYFLKDFSKASTVIELAEQSSPGFILQDSRDSKTSNATLKVLIENHRGVVISPVNLDFSINENGTACSENSDVLQMTSSSRTMTFCSNDPPGAAKKHPGYRFEGSEVSISFARKSKSTSGLDLTVTAFTYPVCNFEYACGNKICVWDKLKCDGRDNCGDGSDEVACPYKLWFDDTTSSFIFLYILAGVAVAVVLILAAIICYQGTFNICGEARPDNEPNDQVPNPQG